MDFSNSFIAAASAGMSPTGSRDGLIGAVGSSFNLGNCNQVRSIKVNLNMTYENVFPSARAASPRSTYTAMDKVPKALNVLYSDSFFFLNVRESMWSLTE